jgi:poly(A) polymerase
MAEQIMIGLRYDNKTIQTVRELVQHHMQFKDVLHMRQSTLKRMMQRENFSLELELHRIDCSSSHGDLRNFDFLKQQLETMSAEEIDPPPFITGRDLLAMGLHPGREVGRILEAIRVAQLEGTVQTQSEALGMARRLASAGTQALPPPPPPKAPDGEKPPPKTPNS